MVTDIAQIQRAPERWLATVPVEEWVHPCKTAYVMSFGGHGSRVRQQEVARTALDFSSVLESPIPVAEVAHDVPGPQGIAEHGFGIYHVRRIDPFPAEVSQQLHAVGLGVLQRQANAILVVGVRRPMLGEISCIDAAVVRAIDLTHVGRVAELFERLRQMK